MKFNNIMTRISLSLNKSVEQNAGIYFEKAKKGKLKLEGAGAALEKSKKKLEKILKEQKIISQNIKIKIDRQKEWYEKFHWFISSEGFLVIGGRDATSNEIVIKKHAEKDDIVFHTDMAGSPFFVIKSEGKKPGKNTSLETADATASYSRGWKKGLAEQNVFFVRPEQVSKTAKSGESLAKGAFMIYGKTEYIENKMRIAIGIKDGQIIGGPVDAIRTHAEKFIEIIQGNGKASDIAKKIRKTIGGDLDEIIRFLPSGGCKISN